VSDNPPCESLASAAVSHADARGFLGAEAHIEHTLTRVVTWDSAAVLSAVSLPAKTRCRVDVRVYTADGRCGVASGEARDSDAVCALVDKAADAMGPPNPFAGPATRHKQTDVGLGLMDRRHPTIEEQDREDAVNGNIEDVRSAVAAEPLAFRYTEILRTRAMAASNGNARSERGTHYTLSGKVASADGQHVIESSVQSRLFADAASLPLGTDLANQVARYVDPQPMPSGDMPILIGPGVVAKIMAAVVPAFERDRVDAGASFLTDGRQVGSEKLHMIDDALLAGGLATRAFDARGVPALDLPLIREGTVGALYQGTELARELNGRSSGHEGLDGTWHGNLILRPGTRSRNMITPELGPYLLFDELTVTGAKWFDLETGKLRLKGHFFSATAGESPVYLGVHRINTNFVALWSAIREVANDQRRFGTVDVSTWVVDGLSIG
jgi:predicted Zn-dependent protease